MKRNARILMAALLAAGLWLALKPTLGNRRLTFLPVAWSEHIDRVDFWFNLVAFAMLTMTTWLALSTDKILSRAGWTLGVITGLNVMIELAQASIPGRAMDFADVWAGFIGCISGIVGGFALQLMTTGRNNERSAPQVLFLDQTGQLGGAELMLLDIAAARAADSDVILFQDGEFRHKLEQAHVKTRVFELGEQASGVDKQACAKRVLRSIPGLLDLVLRLAQASRAFDVVYANTAKALIIGGPAAKLAGKAVVFHLHDIIANGHFSEINQRSLIFCANTCASVVIANSEATKEAFIRCGGRSELCVVVPNGFRIPETRSSEVKLQSLRTSLDIPADTLVVLMAGRLSHWKGQHVLLEALKSVPQAHAVLLGDALFTDEDREYAHKLHLQAAEPELAGRIHFAGFQTETLAYFDLADVVVHASVFPEPFGRVIVEGMLAGKPVIASRAGGAAEILQHEHTGLLVEPGCEKSLSEALLRLQNNSAFAASLAQNAQQTARETYDLPAVQAKIEAVIHQTSFPANETAAANTPLVQTT